VLWRECAACPGGYRRTVAVAAHGGAVAVLWRIVPPVVHTVYYGWVVDSSLHPKTARHGGGGECRGEHSPPEDPAGCHGHAAVSK